MSVAVFAWAVLGLISGAIAGKIVHNTREGTVADIVLGIIGAILGGWVLGLRHIQGATGLDMYSLLAAVGGAILVVALYHTSFRAHVR